MTRWLLISLALSGACRVDQRARLEGSVQKGPLVLGSNLSVSPVDDDGEPTGEVFQTQIHSDAGDFSVTVNGLGPVRLQGEGFFYDEVSGHLSSAPLTLRAIYDLEQAGPQQAQVNVLTHLSFDRARVLMKQGKDPADAVVQAERELVTALAVGPVGSEPQSAGTRIHLLGGDDHDSRYLFALSALILQSAVGSQPTEARLTEMMSSWSLDLAGDGQLEPQVRDTLEQAERDLPPYQTIDHLAARLQRIGSTATVPDLNQVLDTDQDSVVNAWDNCVFVPNPNQADGDGDGVGDACYLGVDTQPEEYDVDDDGYTVEDGDCDDNDDKAHPGAIDEKFNAKDLDCDGDNDMDGDEDGWMDERREVNGRDLPDAFTDYIHRYGYTHIVEQYGDCLDAPDAALPGVDPASVHPGATDTPYDGVDSDCDPDGTREFDADGDGWADDPNGAFVDYFIVHGYDPGDLGYHGTGDCDDGDADTHPLAPETFGDSVDRDCVGGPDGFGWQRETQPTATLTNPGRVHIVRNNRHFVLGFRVDVFAGSQPNVGMAMLFDPGAPQPSPVKNFWHPFDSQRPLGDAMAMIPVNDGFVLATSKVTNGRTYFILKRATYQPAQPLITYTNATGDQVNVTADASTLYDAIDLQLSGDGNTLWAAGLNAEILHVATIDTNRFDLDVSWHTSGASGTSVLVDPTNPGHAVGTTCDSAGCTSYDLDHSSVPATITPLSTPELPRATLMRRKGQDLLTVHPGGVTVFDEVNGVSYDYFAGSTVVDADFCFQGGELYVAAVIGNKVELLHGDPTGLMAASTLDPAGFDSRDITLHSAAVQADANYVLFAVSGTNNDQSGDDMVSWGMLQR